jgi:hypothetical protein
VFPPPDPLAAEPEYRLYLICRQPSTERSEPFARCIAPQHFLQIYVAPQYRMIILIKVQRDEATPHGRLGPALFGPHFTGI